MQTPEEELINELMRLTGQSREDVEGLVDTIKRKMLGETKPNKAGNIRNPFTVWSGDSGKDDIEEDNDEEFEDNFDEDAYPAYLPSDNVLKYTLRFTLKDIRPSIWRKVEVPSNITLRHLSELIIEVMGWSGYHLNQFRVGVDTYYEPAYQKDAEMEEFSFSRIHHYNQEDHTIAELLKEKGKHIIFEYDFGDSWEHEVKLSSVGEYKDGDPRVIRFLSGKRACPPEDCGGVWGYEELCAISEKKKSGKRLTRDERERLEWYSEGEELFDPEYLDLDWCAEAAEGMNDF